MGKKIIIKDADFSTNALETGSTYTDITSLFSFTDGSAYSANIEGGTAGNLVSSTNFSYTSSVDISAYVGRTLRITFVSFTTSGGNISNFGDVFLDANSDALEGYLFPKDGDTPSSMTTYYKDITIPATAKYFLVTYPKTTKIAEIGGLTFAAFIEDE